MVVESWAVTTITTELAPTFRLVTSWPAPLFTALPSTVIVARPWLAVGVTVTWVAELATPAAYPRVESENDGLRVPGLIVRPVRLASLEGGAARVTVMV